MIKHFCDRCGCEFEPEKTVKGYNKYLLKHGGIEVASVFTMKENPVKNGNDEPPFVYDRRMDFCPECFVELNKMVTEFVDGEGMFCYTPGDDET